MALIRCPACRARMSSLAETCPACGASRDPSRPLDEAAILALQRGRLRQQRYRARMASYTAMTLVMAGVIAWWLDSGLLGSPGRGATVLMAVGAVGYFGVRAWLYVLAIRLRRLREP
jgi:hypothetical protein